MGGGKRLSWSCDRLPLWSDENKQPQTPNINNATPTIKKKCMDPAELINQTKCRLPPKNVALDPASVIPSKCKTPTTEERLNQMQNLISNKFNQKENLTSHHVQKTEVVVPLQESPRNVVPMSPRPEQKLYKVSSRRSVECPNSILEEENKIMNRKELGKYHISITEAKNTNK